MPIDNWLMQIAHKVVVVVMPHPDDETVMMGGLLQRLNRLGFEVTLLCLTKGEKGRIYGCGWGRNMMEIRTQELRKALRNLGTVNLQLFSYPDAGLKMHTDWHNEIHAVLQKLQPGLVISYDPTGFSGHPDHIASSKEVFRQVSLLSHVELLWISLDKNFQRYFLTSEISNRMQPPSHELQLTLRETWRKSLALLNHWSQGLWLKPGLWIWVWWIKREYYCIASKSDDYQFTYSDYQV